MSWFHLENGDELPTPTLVLYEERLAENLRLMVEMVGDPNRLRPHLKTHKLPQVLYKLRALGVTKCKCATIAEAEMAALSGMPDVLLAGQPVGANALRFLQLMSRYPQTTFTALVDDRGVLEMLGELAAMADLEMRLMIDLDVGQHRSGVVPGVQAAALVEAIEHHSHLIFAGLHAYDGHLSQSDSEARRAACEAAFVPVMKLRETLREAGFSVPEIVAGGSPTFLFHAARAEVTCSPGTCVFWDEGYSRKLPDLPFRPAAYLVARVISKPAVDLLTLDLGHKAVGSEMAHPRVVFPELSEVEVVLHNEEHLVFRCAEAAKMAVGQIVYGIPWHICPTVALHSEVWLAKSGVIIEAWPVVGRARRIHI
jgi:D-serine deaminase-like pyridoxal phosphate-dependent protein